MYGLRSGLSGLSTRLQFGGETFDGFAILEVLLYYLGYVLFYDAQVPGATRVDDKVRAVLTEAEAIYRVRAYVPVYTLRAQLLLERLADGLGSALFAVASLADEHVGVVVPDLRGRLCEPRQRATLLRSRHLLATLRDGFLRFQRRLAPCGWDLRLFREIRIYHPGRWDGIMGGMRFHDLARALVV